MNTYLLPPRAFLRLTGPDSLRYLNGQITQRVEDTHSGATLWTAITNAKGGIEGVGCVQKVADGYLIDCPLALGDAMEARLDKYLIADDCEWLREDDRWQITISAAPGTSQRYRQPHQETLIDTTSEKAPELPILPTALEDLWRTHYGVPAWEAEITAGMLPVECGLHKLALSFNKGCYIGQEIISRIEAAGKRRRSLYALSTPAGQSLPSELEYTTVSTVENTTTALLVAKKPPQNTTALCVTEY